ncbi:MAG: hypothetical protein OEU92_08660, partial [Alphaproteobacteria bacterium]|nr:hypothetical protein [Alphaproteobacteria bacterium]
EDKFAQPETFWTAVIFQQNTSCPGNGPRGQGTEKERRGERNSGEMGGFAGAVRFRKAFYFKGF